MRISKKRTRREDKNAACSVGWLVGPVPLLCSKCFHSLVVRVLSEKKGLVPQCAPVFSAPVSIAILQSQKHECRDLLALARGLLRAPNPCFAQTTGSAASGRRPAAPTGRVSSGGSPWVVANPRPPLHVVETNKDSTQPRDCQCGPHGLVTSSTCSSTHGPTFHRLSTRVCCLCHFVLY